MGTTPTGPQLITYADRLGGDIRALDGLLSGPFAGAFQGFHLLPFYTPFDGADAGFDPADHTAVDPRLGTWDDLAAVSRGRVAMADVIVNHVSVDSTAFADVRRDGDRSPYARMFLTLSSIFPAGATEEDLARIYRPRPGLPFTTMRLGDRDRLVWTTFTPQQVDLDIRSPLAWDYLASIIDALTAAGVTMLRLDAIGYAGKEAGTDCFMTASTHALIARLSDHAHARGAQVLLEIHGYYREQIEVAGEVDWVYDFALPPLVLHALGTGDLRPLGTWLDVRPSNAITVLDTHDGIGVIDVGPGPSGPGLLTPAQIDALVEGIHEGSGGTSREATGVAASNLDLYQVNCTFYDALGRDDRRYLLARLIQLFVPGIPQVYYVGLLAGCNDLELLRRTGVGRDVNRHYYAPGEVAEALRRPVVKAQLAALRLRHGHPAFGGSFTWRIDGSTGELRWVDEAGTAVLRFDAMTADFDLQVSGTGFAELVAAVAPTSAREADGSVRPRT